MKIRNVLSLFHGMGCFNIAAKRAGLQFDKCYTSEIDPFANTVDAANNPGNINLGNVSAWRFWQIDWPKIDLLMGGSPCQGFIFAGKQLAFDDPRSKLFFVYVEILNHIRSVNPAVKFMLENVKMKKEYLTVISEQLGVEPVFINSALVSAQNRQRYYWANWGFAAPEDRGMVLADVLETDPVGATFMSEKFKGRNARILRDDLTGKSRSLSDMEYVKNGRQGDYINHAEVKTVCFNHRIKGVTENERGIRYNKGDEAKSGISELGRILKSTARYTDTLTTNHMPKLALNNNLSKLHYRKLTPVECERLQTVPDNYTAYVSNTQRYKMLGNGWTVDVIAHILGAMG